MPRNVSELSGIYPTDCPTLNKVRDLFGHWNWTLTPSGYIRYSLGGGPAVYEHRLVAEIRHGSGIKNFHVHHVDGRGTNNAERNLEVLTPSEHSKIHRFGKRKKLARNAMRHCTMCGAEIWREERLMKLYSHSFCNHECRKNYHRANGFSDKRPYTEPPPLEELERLRECYSREEIAQMFDCSKHTVSRWITRYKLGRINTND